jgi:hypothetical protein
MWPPKNLPQKGPWPPSWIMNLLHAGPSAAVVRAHTPPERPCKGQGLPISSPISGDPLNNYDGRRLLYVL